MADESEATAWARAIATRLAANEKSGREPSSLRALAKALAGRRDAGQTFDSWYGTLKRLNNGRIERPSEANAKKIAEELGVSRARLPAAQKVSTTELDRRLRLLEERAVFPEDLIQATAPLREAIELVATGNTREALRVLSEQAAR